MKKFILDIHRFLLFTSLFYILVIVLWSYVPYFFLKPNSKVIKGSYGNTFTRFEEAKKTKDIDVLILGSSHAYRGFDTRIFKKNNIQSFNMGSSAQTPIQTLALVKRYIDKINPKLILFEINPGVLSSDGVESSLDIINNDNNDIYSFEMALKQNNIKTYNYLVVNYYQNIFNINNNFKEAQIRGEDRYIKGGFVEKKVTYYTPKKINKNLIVINQNQLTALKSIIEETKKRNMKVILIYAPVTQNLYNSYTNKEYFDTLMTSYSEYYNFNKILKLKDTQCFYDSNHLNQIGVELFNAKLVEILKARSLKKD